MKRLLEKIKEKFTKHSEWWINYLTEMSVVVISLGATYYGDSLIENYMEKQEDRKAILMIRYELVSNLKELEDIDRYYQEEIKFSEALTDKLMRKKRISTDSIQNFQNQHRLYYYWFLKNNAFDMVRESGAIQRVDKTLLMKLFECYEQLEVVKDMGVRYREERIKRLAEFTTDLPEGLHAVTVTEQWKQIDRHKIFRQYLMITIPLMAKSTLAIERNAALLVQKTMEEIDRFYPPD